MKPGKRPDNQLKKQRHRHDRGSANNFPKQWDIRITTMLQRCILSHDLYHILNWHTPLYTLFVYLSIVSTLIGISKFESTLQYFCALCVTAIVVFGIAKKLQVESGASAVVAPTEMRVRNKSTVENNVKTLYARWCEPAVEFLSEKLISKKSLKDLRIVGGSALVLLLIGELAKYVSTSIIFVIIVTIGFGIGGVRKLGGNMV